MERPTQDAVSAALRSTARDNLGASSSQVILADEVRALRDEVDRLNNLLGQYAATFNRVEALCAENEARNGDRELCWMVADEYRAALRGPT